MTSFFTNGERAFHVTEVDSDTVQPGVQAHVRVHVRRIVERCGAQLSESQSQKNE